MVWMSGIALALAAAVLFGLSVWREAARRITDAAACAAAFIFFAVAGAAVARTIMNGTVFMTEVHSVLENISFLASGSYLGPYVVGKLALAAWRTGDRRHGD